MSKIIENNNISQLARDLKVNRRTVSGWFNEESSMPLDVVKNICQKHKIIFPKNIELKDRFWYTKKGGKIGGIRAQEIHGNPGTVVGRIKGGMKSAEVNSRLYNNFKRRKIIKKPVKSKILSELIGIILGDGNVSNYFISITLNSKTDKEYSEWVGKVLIKLFNLIPKSVICDRNVLQIIVYGVNLIEFIEILGLVKGNKIKQQVTVPDWIISNEGYSRSCLRGLIDTDGCVYFDKHRKGNVLYNNICIDFTNRSKPLLSFVYNTLVDNGIFPRIYGYSIKIRKERDVIKYHKIIGFSNKKHDNKFSVFMKEKYGEVA